MFGPENSRLRPMWYPRIFIPCDFVSLVLQGTGGGMASVASNNNSDPKPGNHIMLAGLAFQAATMFVFILLSLDFALRTYGRVKGLGADKALDHQYHELRRSPAFRAFLAALALATLLIFTRCVYRVAELSEGWNGHLILTQSYFLVLESAVVIIACLLLNAAHPAFCFAAGYATGTSGFFGRNWKKTNAARSRQWSDTGAKAPV